MLRAAALPLLAHAAAGLGPDDLVHRAIAIMNVTRKEPNLGVINGRETRAGEWEGTIMVTGSNGECTDSGLCTGMFIHPEIVMTAGHCCGNGATKAICGGKERPGTRLARSRDVVTATSGANDFCLLRLDAAVHDVPIYEVATSVQPEDAVIVGYGVNNPGFPQEGAGIQREGLVRITRVSGYDLTITGRTSGEYNNACNGDSGGPIFIPRPGHPGDFVVAGVTSRGSLYCPLNSNGIYTSAVEARNAELIRSTSARWLGERQMVEPGQCPVAQCCYSMTCGAAPAKREWCAAAPAPQSRTPPAPAPGAEFRGAYRDVSMWVAGAGGCGSGEAVAPYRKGNDGLWVVEFDHSLDLWREKQRALRAGVPVLLTRGLTLVIQAADVPDKLGYDACGQNADKRVISVSAAAVRGPRPLPRATLERKLREARTRQPAIVSLLDRVSRDSLTGMISHMQDYSSRNSYSGNNGLDQACEWVAGEFTKYGFNVTRHRFRDDMTPQVIAELPGVSEPEKVIVVGAHYDSRGTQNSSPTQRAPGADDNGSGSAATLELARIIAEHGARFRYTLRLMLFTGEEQGLIGSRAIASEYARDGVDVIAMFNTDMIGYKAPDIPITLSFMQRFADLGVTEVAMETARTYVPGLPAEYTNVCCSDQQSFYENGFPSVGIFETPTNSVVYPHYHRSTDLLEYINMEQVEKQSTATMASAALWAELLE